MEKQIITTKNAPTAIGPYSQAVKIGNLVYTSGQIPVNPKNGELLTGDIKEQTMQVIENLKAVLEEAGTSLDNVIKSLVFLSDMNNFASMNEVYGTYFSEKQPARSCVEVARLPKDVAIEMEVIAIIPE